MDFVCLFVFKFGGCAEGGGNRGGLAYPQSNPRSTGGLNAVPGEQQWGQPSCRWKQHRKFQSHLPASCLRHLGSTQVSWGPESVGISNEERGLSLRRPGLPALPAQSRRFSASGLPRKASLADRQGLADRSSTFQEFGEEEFLFRRPQELTLNSGLEVQLLMEL